MPTTQPKPFTPEQDKAYQTAKALIDTERLKTLLFDVTDIHSPTGATHEISEFVAGHMETIGLTPTIDPMNDISSNVMGEKRGAGGGANLLLYAPLDTHLEGDETDFPWAGPKQFVDLKPEAKQNGDWIYGLGSSNPKAMIAGLLEVATVLEQANVPLMGDLTVAFADGGMPVTVPHRDNAGMSHGVHHLIARGLSPDFAIIMKPNNTVYYEEPGMGWFKVTVRGTLGYAGVPHDLPQFRSAIVPSAHVILAIQEWLIAYADANTSGQITPHGWLAAVRSGWPERPAFPSGATELYLDIRINPRTSPGDVKAQFARFIEDLKIKDPSLDLDWEMYGAVPGGTTDPDNWIIQAGQRAWEHVEQAPFQQPTGLAGQTDGAALRRMGIPTARMGWEWPAEGSPEDIAEGLGGMGATYVPDLVPCIEKILYAAIDTLMRPRGDLGL